jgi:two-component system chemotaxis response regulator CheB
MSKKIRVLIVDDQAVVRSFLAKGLSEFPEIEVIGKAGDAWEARDLIVEHEPDVVTLDVEMPKMNGLQFLKKLMPQYPLPIIMVSSLTQEGQSTTIEALESGAVDFVAKPDGSEGSMPKMISELHEKIIIASKVDVSGWKVEKSAPKAKKPATKKLNLTSRNHISLIAIGASTGGTTAIIEIISSLPQNMPGIIIVQHMPEGFTRMFANRLNTLSELEVKEAEDFEEIKPGKVLIAPGDKHLLIEKSSMGHRVRLSNGEKVTGHRPSVDAMFSSISEISIARETLGIILTGMGKDGAEGLRKMRDRGSKTIGQDQASCVVYGMPREAFLLGGVEKQVPLSEIPEAIIEILR